MPHSQQVLTSQEMRNFLHLMIIVLVACCAAIVAAEQPVLQLDEIELPGTDGKNVIVKRDQSPFTVVCFLGTECPLAKLYGPRLEHLQTEFARYEVRFVGINSNEQDSMDDLQRYSEQHKLSFPMAKDYGNVIADQFQAQRTPEVFVLDRDLRVVYQGRIDDQYAPGVTRPEPTSDELRDALAAAVAGKPIQTVRTEATGCIIGRAKKKSTEGSVTYCDQISRLFQKHCVECHRSGEIGPFAMTDYEEIVGWADMILEVVHEHRMPPWHADPKYGRFKNERRMTDEEQQLLRSWVDAGVPYGQPSKLPEPNAYNQNWQLPREPDMVLAMSDQPFTVPAEGTVDYQYFVVDPGFEEDKWITVAEVMPGNRSVLHHTIVFIRPPDGGDFRGMGYLTGYVPGQRVPKPLPGRAKFVPAGSRLVFQQHYTPTGTEQNDLTKIGIVFANPSDVTHELMTQVAINQDFEIPPHASDYEVNASLQRVPKRGELVALIPHMHVRGKAMRIHARRGDRQETLLDVPRYDFNWQHTYENQTPISLGDIDELGFTARFDNSDSNPTNPNPTQYVTWGDQTWEEMAVAFFMFSIPREPTDLSVAYKSNPILDEEVIKNPKVTEFVEQYIKRFDTNGDEQIDRAEVPLATRGFAFRKFDKNNDSLLSREELLQAAEERFK